MRILVTFAVEAEFAPWRKKREFRCIAKTPFEIYDASVGGHTVRVLLTGIGWECARRTAASVMEDVFDACISSGLAGGLKDAYRAADILAFRDVGEISGERVMASSKWLLDQAARQGASVAGKLLTSKKLVLTSGEKKRFGTFGDAVDMESFRIMAAAQGRGIPALTLRAISDTVEEDLPMDFSEHVSENGQIAVGRVLGKIAFSPQIIPAMIRFGSRTKHVTERLDEFLDAFILGLRTDSAASMEEVVAR
jgi:adenosylhomocysteine nucleosidase